MDGELLVLEFIPALDNILLYMLKRRSLVGIHLGITESGNDLRKHLCCRIQDFRFGKISKACFKINICIWIYGICFDFVEQPQCRRNWILQKLRLKGNVSFDCFS